MNIKALIPTEESMEARERAKETRDDLGLGDMELPEIEEELTDCGFDLHDVYFYFTKQDRFVLYLSKGNMRVEVPKDEHLRIALRARFNQEKYVAID